MKTKAIGLTVGICMLAICGAATAQAASKFCISIVGTKMGAFRGQSQSGMCGTRIEGLAFDYSVISPRDAVTGQASAKRMHKPVRIVKEWGAASPQLFQALTQNENLKEVVFDFIMTDQMGQEVIDHTIKLSNAFVSSIRHTSDVPDAAVEGVSSAKQNVVARGPAMETVEFVFQQIELMDHRSKSGAMDSRMAP